MGLRQIALVLVVATAGAGTPTFAGTHPSSQRAGDQPVRRAPLTVPGGVDVTDLADGARVEVAVRMEGPSAGELRNRGATQSQVRERRRQIATQQRRYVRQARRAAPAVRAEGQLRELANAVLLLADPADLPRLGQVPGAAEIVVLPQLETAQRPAAEATGQSAATTSSQVGADALRQTAGVDGDGVRVAVLDSGIDYTHARLGGSGDSDDYQAAADAKQRGELAAAVEFPTDTVVDGIDLVGPTWGEDPDPVEGSPLETTPNPLDVEGHGTHVADILAGEDGIAPGADLLAVQVCSSVSPACSAIAALEGMEWAVTEGDADVVNLSLGAPYEPADPAASLFAEATATARDAGVVVAAAAGNFGNLPYSAGSPGAGGGVLSAAESVLGELTVQPITVNVDDAAVEGVRQAWSHEPTETISAPVAGGIADDPADDVDVCADGGDALDPGGQIALLASVSDCPASEQAAAVADAGAEALVVAGTSGLEPRRDCPDDACEAIPVYTTGLVDAEPLREAAAADGQATIDPQQATTTGGELVPTTARGPASTHRRTPDVAAPGAEPSAVAGSGNDISAFGGTSGASPVVAGAVALLLDAGTPVDDLAARLMGTAEADLAGPDGGELRTSRGGVGELRADRAHDTDVVVYAPDAPGRPAAADFGVVPVGGDETVDAPLTVDNTGDEARTLQLTVATDEPAPDGVDVTVQPEALTLSAGERAQAEVTLRVTADALDRSPMDSGLTGGRADLFDATEVSARVRVDDVDGDRLATAAVHALPRPVAAVEVGDASRVTANGSRLRLTNGGVADTDVALFDLVGTGTGDVDALGVGTADLPSEPCGDVPALLFALSLADGVAHANMLRVTLSASTTSRPIDLAVADSGIVHGAIEGTTVTLSPNDPRMFSVEHGFGSANVVLPTCPQSLGLAAGDEGGVVDVSVEVAPASAAEPAGEADGSFAFDRPRFASGEEASVPAGDGIDMEIGGLDDAAAGVAEAMLAMFDAPSDGDLPRRAHLPDGRHAAVISPTGGIRRLSGADRFATAVAISRDAFADGDGDTVVLARGDDFADALAGSPLAARHEAPLLLTSRSGLTATTADEIERLLGDDGHVVLLGGRQALSSQVADDVEALGYGVRRVAGDTRVDTAIEVAGELGDPDEVLIADGYDFPDALTAGAAAAARDAAVVLTEPGRASGPLADYLDTLSADAVAVGGPAAEAFPQADAVVGATRFETAAELAQRFDDPRAVGLARGDDFPDALAGSAHVAALGGPVLLTTRDELHPAAAGVLCGTASSVAHGFAYGGTAALSDGTVDEAGARLAGESC